MNNPMSAMKFPAFRMALLLVVTIPSFATSLPPTNFTIDGVPTSQPGGQTVFSCGAGSFVIAASAAPSTPCAIGTQGQSTSNGFNVTGANFSVEGGAAYLGDSGGGGGHIGVGMTYQKAVNVQAFTATFTFVPNGKNIVFVLNNATSNIWGMNKNNFSAGAGCEAGFYQAFDTVPVDHVFALELDSFSPLTQSAPYGSYEYSSAQIYSSKQSPCLPPYTPSWTDTQTVPSKLSTYPVPLNSPANQMLTTTGHNYSATIVYDGSNVTLSLYDITAGGSCPGTGCYTHTWTGVNIPSLVGANTAWVGINGGCNSDCVRRINVNSFAFKNP